MSEPIKVRVPFPKAWYPYRIGDLRRIADQINESAQGRRMLGQLDPPGDGKTRLSHVSHVVLPTARVEKNAIFVELELLDTEAGRQAAAMLRGGAQMKANPRGFGSSIQDAKVTGVNLDFNPPPRDWTVLDDILGAVDRDDEGELAS